MLLLSYEQKKLIVAILKKEQRKLISLHKGTLLDKTIADLSQMIRNEETNAQ